MARVMAARQMQTPAGGPASAETKHINSVIIGDDLSADKPFRTLQAAFALKGHALCRTDPKDGPVILYAGRWGMVRALRDLDDAAAFLQQIGDAP